MEILLELNSGFQALRRHCHSLPCCPKRMGPPISFQASEIRSALTKLPSRIPLTMVSSMTFGLLNTTIGLLPAQRLTASKVKTHGAV